MNDLSVRRAEGLRHRSSISYLPVQIEDDAYQEDLGFSLGQLGKSGSGRVRQAQVNEATKARISKSLQVKSLMAHLHASVDQYIFLSGLISLSNVLLFTTADPAEAKHDVWGEVHCQRPLLGNELQRSIHAPTGNGKENPSSVTMMVRLCSPLFCSRLQGLEIVNPQAAEKKVAEANQKYFSNKAEFLKVKNETKM